MKKLFISLLMCFSITTASAHSGDIGTFIGGAVVGGVIGSMVNRPIYQPMPVYSPMPAYPQYPSQYGYQRQCYLTPIYDTFGRYVTQQPVCN